MNGTSNSYQLVWSRNPGCRTFGFPRSGSERCVRGVSEVAPLGLVHLRLTAWLGREMARVSPSFPINCEIFDATRLRPSEEAIFSSLLPNFRRGVEVSAFPRQAQPFGFYINETLIIGCALIPGLHLM